MTYDPLEFFPHAYILDNPRMPRPVAIEGIMRVGDLCLLTGGWDTFKSTLSLELAWSLSTGRPLLNRYPIVQRIRTGILQVEIDPGSYDERAQRFPRAEDLLLASCMGFNFDRIEELKQVVDDNGLEGLVLDPLGQLWPTFARNGEPFSENLKNHVSPVMGELKKLGITVILVHHDPKPGQGGYQGRAAGSSALLNDPDVRMFLDRSADDIVQVTVRNRLQRPAKPFKAIFNEDSGRLTIPRSHPLDESRPRKIRR